MCVCACLHVCVRSCVCDCGACVCVNRCELCVRLFACVHKATRKYIRMVCVWFVSFAQSLLRARFLFLAQGRKDDFRDTEKFCLAILSVSLRFEILDIKSGINLDYQEFYIIFSTHIGVCANTHTIISLSHTRTSTRKHKHA